MFINSFFTINDALSLLSKDAKASVTIYDINNHELTRYGCSEDIKKDIDIQHHEMAEVGIYEPKQDCLYILAKTDALIEPYQECSRYVGKRNGYFEKACVWEEEFV